MGRTSDARERILDHAAELFHERGYGSVGIADICTAAGVNKGSFYHFFPSKQQLVLDVVDGFWYGARDMIEETLAPDAPPLDRLRRYLDRISAHHDESCSLRGQQRGCPLANLGLELATQDALVRQRIQHAFEAQVRYFEDLLREAAARGDLVDGIDTGHAAEALIAFVEGKILLAKLRDDSKTLHDLAPEALRLVGARPPDA